MIMLASTPSRRKMTSVASTHGLRSWLPELSDET
jgi:hypothetical protein